MIEPSENQDQGIKPRKKNPSLKQRSVVKELVENGGSVSGAMRKVGYSPATAKNPNKLTDSEGFKQLAAEFLPDDLLLKVHKEGLKAVDPKGNPDYNARHKYLDTGYKVRELVKQPNSIGFALQVNMNKDRDEFVT